MLDDLKLSPIKYNKECNYISNLDDQDNDQIKENIKDLLLYCPKFRPYMAFYKMQIKTCNNTTHHILKNEVDLILPKFPEGWRSKRGIFSTIITGFIGLAFEGISSFLHNKRHIALHKAVKAMSVQTDIQSNKLMHLENTLVIYGIYNAETLEKLVKHFMYYTTDNHHMKVCLQARHQQHMNFTHKCMVHEAYNIMKLTQGYI